jgi:hypothetical protein
LHFSSVAEEFRDNLNQVLHLVSGINKNKRSKKVGKKIRWNPTIFEKCVEAREAHTYAKWREDNNESVFYYTLLAKYHKQNILSIALKTFEIFVAQDNPI